MHEWEFFIGFFLTSVFLHPISENEQMDMNALASNF